MLGEDLTHEHAEITFDYDIETFTILLQTIAVEEGYLRQGYGKAIMLDFIDRLQDWNYREIRLTALPADCISDHRTLDELIEWYSRFGFRVINYVIIRDFEAARMSATRNDLEAALDQLSK